ncbi:hypothetical protein M758_8G116200 [Ceratodon purpureus]|nr:hypothetical protein M758_8G116200 [Ceratodon purpureus]
MMVRTDVVREMDVSGVCGILLSGICYLPLQLGVLSIMAADSANAPRELCYRFQLSTNIHHFWL